MSLGHGNKIVTDGLVFHYDMGNPKSNFNIKQTSNVLANPMLWVDGTNDSATGYGRNGDVTENLRVSIDDDPWGKKSVVWRTIPSGNSGGDGGWNSSYYSIDENYTYRYSVWVRRHTVDTGGVFYFGLNPSIIKNSDGTLLSNPYFTYPSQGSLELNKWYLVVYHCFHKDYTGGAHKDSGWYEKNLNGYKKIANKHYGNIGTEDCRWNPGTTTALHRTYHYYSTSSTSGLEFAYPRMEKCDGNEPTVNDLLMKSETLSDISKNSGIITSYVDYDNNGNFIFNGSNSILKLTDNFNYSSGITLEAVINPTTYGQNTFGRIFDKSSATTTTSGGLSVYMDASTRISFVTNGGSRITTPVSSVPYNTYTHILVTLDYQGNAKIYINGELSTSGTIQGSATVTNINPMCIGGRYSAFDRTFNGIIANTRIYEKVLSEQEVLQNFNAIRGRYGL